jgi:predicted enzyme related to lactoylglutathione lyase
MPSPVQNRIGAVFVPVSDLRRSARWYSELLDVPLREATHEGRIYDLPMAGDAALILDAHKPVERSSQPLCFFWTDDLAQALERLRQIDARIVTEIEDIGSVSTLQFLDPDGNPLMVCQRS